MAESDLNFEALSESGNACLRKNGARLYETERFSPPVKTIVTFDPVPYRICNISFRGRLFKYARSVVRSYKRKRNVNFLLSATVSSHGVSAHVC